LTHSLKAPGDPTLARDFLVSKSAFQFNLYRYTENGDVVVKKGGVTSTTQFPLYMSISQGYAVGLYKLNAVDP
jgi:hypothetical protein